MLHWMRFRFGLRAMLLATAVAAYFFTALRRFALYEALILVAMIGLAVGLIQQACDIVASLRTAPNPTSSVTRRWWVAAAWRTAIASSLLICSGQNWIMGSVWHRLTGFHPDIEYDGPSSLYHVTSCDGDGPHADIGMKVDYFSELWQ